MTVCMEARTHGLLEQLNDSFDGGYMLNKETLWEHGKTEQIWKRTREQGPPRIPLGEISSISFSSALKYLEMQLTPFYLQNNLEGNSQFPT